jgi:hypothetical protein
LKYSFGGILMTKKVAVEKNLDNVKELFQSEGYKVESFDDTQISEIKSDKYDAVILSGGNENFMGEQDTRTKSPVIDATGMTPQEIFNMVNRKD